MYIRRDTRTSLGVQALEPPVMQRRSSLRPRVERQTAVSGATVSNSSVSGSGNSTGNDLAASSSSSDYKNGSGMPHGNHVGTHHPLGTASSLLAASLTASSSSSGSVTAAMAANVARSISMDALRNEPHPVLHPHHHVAASSVAASSSLASGGGGGGLGGAMPAIYITGPSLEVDEEVSYIIDKCYYVICAVGVGERVGYSGMQV